jgi:serine/threonine protein kinase
MLGSGTYRCIYLGIKNSTFRQVSIKDAKIESEARPIPPAVLRELAFLREVDYPHIIRLTSNNVFVEHQPQQPTMCSLVYEFGTVDVHKMIQYYSRIQKR